MAYRGKNPIIAARSHARMSGGWRFDGWTTGIGVRWFPGVLSLTWTPQSADKFTRRRRRLRRPGAGVLQTARRRWADPTGAGRL
jgi:hypothetical protein